MWYIFGDAKLFLSSIFLLSEGRHESGDWTVYN